jgi:hypothetical protein
MGALGAQAMADAVRDGSVSLRTVVAWHLGSNHYPPVHEIFVPTALAAIDAVKEGDDTPIEMPNGRVLSPFDIVDQLHLWDFIGDEEERHEDD